MCSMNVVNESSIYFYFLLKSHVGKSKVNGAFNELHLPRRHFTDFLPSE